MISTDKLLAELNNDRRINKQLKMANALLRKSEAAKIEHIEKLEALIRDMWREMTTCPGYATPPCMTYNICEQIRNLEIESGGVCKVVASSTDGLTTNKLQKWFELSCGHTFKLYGLGKPVACPVCGRKVVER